MSLAHTTAVECYEYAVKFYYSVGIVTSIFKYHSNSCQNAERVHP